MILSDEEYLEFIKEGQKCFGKTQRLFPKRCRKGDRR